MSKRELRTGQTLPTVRLVDKEGSIFVGKYLRARDVNINGKPNRVYEFTPVDGDAPITIKEGKGYKEVDVDTNSIVALFGTKAINEAMDQAKPGETIEFVFNGKKKLEGGRKFNDFTINVVE